MNIRISVKLDVRVISSGAQTIEQEMRVALDGLQCDSASRLPCKGKLTRLFWHQVTGYSTPGLAFSCSEITMGHDSLHSFL